jgi:hypothetical protein
MSEKFKKALRIAVNVGCGFEGDAEDAAELLTLITGLESRIAELEKDNDEFRQLIHDWSIVLEQDDLFQLWHVESVRQAMLEINKEREE